MAERKGGCLCGSIRYTVTGRASFPHFCSCHMCQRWSGAPVVAWVDFPLSSLTWDGPGGAPTLYRSSETAQRGFCSRCGGTLFALDDGSDKICITISTLDDPNSLLPRSHSFPESAPTWLRVSAEAPARAAGRPKARGSRTGGK